MARPSRSQIISASQHNKRKIEKWSMPDLQSSAVNSAGFKNYASPFGGGPSARAAGLTGHARNEGVTSDSSMANSESHDAGYQEGQRKAALEATEQQQQLTELLRVLENPVRCLGSTVAQELIELSLEIARSILQKELETDQSQLAELVTMAVSQLPVSLDATCIAAHPDELARLKRYAAPAVSALTIQWVEDPAMDIGNFRVSRANSLVDGGIEAMLKSVLDKNELSA